MASGIDVTQGSNEWLELRKNRFNGSEIAELIGFSSYTNPIDALEKKRNPPPVSDVTQRYFNHGHEYEMPGFAQFVKAMPNIRQSYTLPSGYYIPSFANINFLAATDIEKYGVSLDGEGSVYDVEIKNPYTYYSFRSGYLDTVKLVHFIQCQWTMAIRERSSMYYVATHFDPETKQFLAIVIWKIDFSVEFFTETIYPLAHKAFENFTWGRPNDLPWADENNQFTKSLKWQELFSTYCTKVFTKKEGHLIAQIIRNKQKK